MSLPSILTYAFELVPWTALGLLLTAIGALVIVIPDWPSIRSRFSYGQLLHARELIDKGGITRNDDGYEHVLKIIDETHDIDNITQVQTVEIRPKKGLGLGREGEYVYLTYSEDTDRERNPVPVRVREVYKNITRELDEQESRFRWAGFMLIAVGSVFQLVGLL